MMRTRPGSVSTKRIDRCGRSILASVCVSICARTAISSAVSDGSTAALSPWVPPQPALKRPSVTRPHTAFLIAFVCPPYAERAGGLRGQRIAGRLGAAAELVRPEHHRQLLGL